MPHRGASPGLLRHNNQSKMGSDINNANSKNSSPLSDSLFSSGQSVSTETLWPSYVNVINYVGLVIDYNQPDGSCI